MWLNSAEKGGDMSLPIMAGPEDIEAIVRYLKTKAAGATIKDIRSAVDSKHVDPRKLTAYQFWAIVSDEGGLLRLADRGREFSRATEAEKPAIYRQIIKS